MEMQSILNFLENKSIFVTGATGFLAKVFIEKILRVQPNVKKLYLLLRAKDSSAALHRFNTEVMEKDLFKVIRETYGGNLDSFILDKICLLPGDITRDGLGLEASIPEELFGEVDVIINLAATTDFYERYDIALGINTFGSANVLNFSKKCRNLRVFLHVSTAYVCGDKEGVILETPLKLGDTAGLDIEMEKKLAQDKLEELIRTDHHVSEKHIASVMKDYGLQRARKYGWPNTYTFTKAMGEMLLGNLRGNMPLVIVRPTIVTCTFKEPFPGWVEGVRSIDCFVVGYGKGKMTCIPGNPQTILDLIPADMVVNAMIVSMAAHADEPAETIYHVGSSMSNPTSSDRVQEYGFRFFREQPWINEDGKPVIVRRGTQLGSRTAVQRYIKFRYLIPLQILRVLNSISCGYLQGMYHDFSRKIKLLTRLVELFSPYIFFNGVFDDMNTEKLRSATKERCGIENDIFYFDPKSINWSDYFMHAHLAGVVKYSFSPK